jgi:DNA-binding GntR family transcriptional regulator
MESQSLVHDPGDVDRAGRPAVVAGGSEPAAEAPRQAIARALEHEIVSGLLMPGQRLDERALSARFGVSRTPVREAIGHLVAQGLVETRARSGTFVVRIALADVLHLFEAMAELEALCGRYAARRSKRGEAALLRQLAEDCAASASRGTERYGQANLRFHDALYAASHNPFLEASVRQIRQKAGVYRRYTLELPGRLERSVEEHFAIVEAIAAGDADVTHRRLLDHVDIRREDYAPFLKMIADREHRDD